MSTDVKLDQVDGTFLVLDARVVKAECSDFMLDSPERHTGGGPNRRALVHDQNDGLTLNFNKDYPGGVTINAVRSLDVKGDLQFTISHHDELLLKGGNPPDETVNLSDVIKSLRQDIASLKTQVSQLQK
ncbi:MAG: hypothetical protein M3Y72_15440 [Acidobacteriota bacterium]|nr:hypothetical protein [Acidobacteriota bacterium]